MRGSTHQRYDRGTDEVHEVSNLAERLNAPPQPPVTTGGTRQRAALERVPARRVEDAVARDVIETLAAEVPVAMHYNGRAHAVMLATPADLDDFALGFTLTERIIRRPDELLQLEQNWTAQGVALLLRIPEVRFALLETRDRNLTGRTGCGLCGTSTLEAAIRPVRAVAADAPRASRQELLEGMQRLATLQPYNEATGAVHAAALLTTDGGFTVREDVGRHNAIDKAVGAVKRAGAVPHSLLVTSRASYEVVHKAAEVGCALVAAISAPTTLALSLAKEAGVTLVGWARPPRLTIYCGELA
jgi:formate dehydrogenase accessory protein FdhD